MARTGPVQLIVAADEPALLFSSVSAAEGKLEARDVRDGVYTAAYGPNGEPFSIKAEGERVIIRPLDAETRPGELIALLRLKLSGKEGSSLPTDLPTLLRLCEPRLDD